MPVCKNKIASDPNEKLCGMEIQWKYTWGAPKPEGEKNKPLNLDGSPHWDTCKANPHAVNVVVNMVDERKEKEVLVEPAPPAKQDIEFQTADVTMEFDRNFRVIQFTVSKSRKCSQVTIPKLPDYESREFFMSQTIAVDNPSIDIINKARQVFAEIDARINEQVDLAIMELSK